MTNNPTSPDPTDRQIAEHISHYLKEMVGLARDGDLAFLAYLLEMARQEAVASADGSITRLDKDLFPQEFGSRKARCN